ncbi:DUF4272 domain-containing protein [Stieleria varia]|nr:DUF4272 domain-containing protein [Stieleria varia]
MMTQSHRDLMQNAKLRAVSEILDALDQNYRLLWAARDASGRQVDPPSQIDGGVISERQHALNWITGFEDAPWGDVDVPS